MNDTSINYCTAEEADPRLLRYAIHQASTGLKNIMIKTVDTDVFLLAVAYCSKLVTHGIRKFFLLNLGLVVTQSILMLLSFLSFWVNIDQQHCHSFTRSVAAIQHLVFTFLENVDSGIPG